MTQLELHLPVPRLLVYETAHLDHMTITPAYLLNAGESAHAEVRTAVQAASDVFSQGTIVLEDGSLESNLSDAISQLSGVDEDDFLRNAVVRLPYTSSLFTSSGSRRLDDEQLLHEALQHADAALDGLRFDYCRLDVPQMCIGPPGYLPRKNMYAVYVRDTASGNARLIAREPVNPLVIPGLGLEIDGTIGSSDVDPLIQNAFPDTSLGVRLKRLLRTFCSSLLATNDEQKILTNIFALDGILTPEDSTSNQFKKYVAISACGNPSAYRTEYDRFKNFYEEVRNPIVHRGKSYSDLQRTRKTDLLYLQSLVGRLLLGQLGCAAMDYDKHWNDVMETARQHL